MYCADPSATYVDQNGPFSSAQNAISDADVMAYWINAGGPSSAAYEAAAIAYAESSGIPNAVNPVDNSGIQTSWGLFQLSNGDHNAPGRYWADPQENARGAVAKYKRAGNSWAQDWGTYGGAAYAQKLAQLQRGHIADPYNATADAGDGTDSNDDNLLEKGINWMTGGEYDKAKGALNVANKIMLVPEHIMNNLGPFLVGMMLLAIGGALLALSWGDRLVVAAEKFVGSNAQNLSGAPGTSTGASSAEGSEIAEAAAL